MRYSIERAAAAAENRANVAVKQARSEHEQDKEQKNLIVGLDIGTSKIVAIVAEILPEAGWRSSAWASTPSRGLKKGVVVNIEATVNAIQRALEEAELMADCKIREVYTGIAGSHIKSFNSHGMVAIKDKEVTPDRRRPRDRDRAAR